MYSRCGEKLATALVWPFWQHMFQRSVAASDDERDRRTWYGTMAVLCNRNGVRWSLVRGREGGKWCLHSRVLLQGRRVL